MILLFQSVWAHSLQPTLPLRLSHYSLYVCLADNTVPCYRIEPGTIAGIISADVLLTLIIVAVTYSCASFRRKKIKNGEAMKLK